MNQRIVLNFLVASFIIGLGSSCSKLVEKTDAYKNIKNQNDSLIASLNSKDAEMLDITKMLDDVIVGIENISAEEKAIALQASTEVDITPSAKERAGESIKTIVLSIEKYKQQIALLEAKMRSNSMALRGTIARLKRQLEEKDLELMQLSEEMGIKAQEVDGYKAQIAQLQANNQTLEQNITVINEQISTQEKTIASKDEIINTAYYLIAKKSDLKKNNILVKNEVNPSMNTRDFKKINIQNTREILLKTAKKVTLESIHPQSSYSIKQDKSGNQILQIKKIDDFWKQTKYLVVSTK